MKRKLLMTIFSLLVCMGNAWASDETPYVYCQDVTAEQGSQIMLPVCWHNDITMAAFDVTITLPEGVTAIAEGEDNTAVTELAERGEGFTVGSRVNDNGTVHVIFFSMEAATIPAGDGPLFYVAVQIADDMAVGEYEVKVSKVTMTNNEEQTVYGTDQTSKLTITGPTLYETSTEMPETTTEAKTWTVNRTIAGGVWNTLCLPFAMTGDQLKSAFGDDVQLADFTGFTASEETNNGYPLRIDMNFTSLSVADGLAANHPCIIKTANDISSFTVKDVILEPKEEPVLKLGKSANEVCSITGTYVAETTVPKKALFLSNNNFYYSKGKTKMKAFRAYFELENVIAAAYNDASSARVGFVVDGEATQIADYPTATADQSDDAVYSLSGQQIGTRANINRLAKGIYIVNGKKITIK